MSRRRMSTRKSLLNFRSSSVAPTDEGGFNALQDSNFALSSTRDNESTNPLSFRETDTSNVEVPPDWDKNLRSSSIGFADNNKENDDKRSTINSDHDSDDPTFAKKNKANRRRVLGKNDARSGSESDNEFQNILLSQMKASQKTQAASVEPAVEDKNSSKSEKNISNSEETQTDPEKLKKSKTTRRKLRSFPSSEESDNNEYPVILSKEKTQQELREKAKADAELFRIPSEPRNSSVVSAPGKEKSLSYRKERSRQSQRSASEEDDIDESKTLRESIIHHKRDSESSIEQSTLTEDDQDDSGSKTGKDNKSSASNTEDVSVHDSDQSSRSSSLKNNNSRSRRGTYTVAQALKSTSSEKDISSVSVHESDRESLSNSTISTRSKSKATEKQIGKKQSSTSERKKLSSSSSESSTQIEPQRRRTRSQSEKLGDFIEQAGSLVNIHEADTESESLPSVNKSKRKRTLEEDPATMGESVTKKMKTTSAQLPNRSFNGRFSKSSDSSLNSSNVSRNDSVQSKKEDNQNQSLNKSANSSRNLRNNSRQSKKDKSQNQSLDGSTHEVARSIDGRFSKKSDSSLNSSISSRRSKSATGSAEKRRNQNVTVRSKSAVSMSTSKDKSTSKLSQTKKRLSFDSVSNKEDADRSAEDAGQDVPSFPGVSKTSNLEGGNNSSSKLSVSKKKNTVISSEDEDDDQSPPEVSTSKAAASRKSSSKLGDSRRERSSASEDEDNDEAATSAEISTPNKLWPEENSSEPSLVFDETDDEDAEPPVEVPESKKTSKIPVSKSNQSKKNHSLINSDSEDEEDDQSPRVSTRSKVQEPKKTSKIPVSKSNQSKKNPSLISNESEDEEEDQSPRVSTRSKVQEPKKTSKIPVSKSNRSKKKTSLIDEDSVDEEAGQSERVSTPAKDPKSKKTAETSISRLTRSRKERSFIHNQSEDATFDQTPVKVPDPKKIAETSVKETRQSRKRASPNLGVDEVEANNPDPSPPKKSKKDTPAKPTVPSPVASTSKQQSPSKKVTRRGIFLKPIQPTLDTFFKKVEKVQPSELGLKYKSLQDFDEQYGSAKQTPELLELRMKLLADPYIMQETNRITSEKLAAEEKERKKKEQAKLAKQTQKKKKQEMELKKQKAEERKRQREEKLAKISNDYKVKGKLYNPKLAMPRKWCTSVLYNFLQEKLEPVHGLQATAKSEQLMLSMVKAVDFITKTKTYPKYKECLNKLKRMLARSNIIVTHNDFWYFAYQYLPPTFRVKAVPMLLPGNVHTIPDWNPRWDDEAILDTI